MLQYTASCLLKRYAVIFWILQYPLSILCLKKWFNCLILKSQQKKLGIFFGEESTDRTFSVADQTASAFKKVPAFCVQYFYDYYTMKSIETQQHLLFGSADGVATTGTE